MASVVNILICSGLAIFIYFCLGFPLAGRVAPRPLAIMLAPGLGWAAHSAAALPLFFVFGMSRITVFAMFVVPLVAAAATLRAGRLVPRGEGVLAWISVAALAVAALLALTVAAAIVPKVSPEGVSLAAPIFDHSKVAMIDEMARLGVPPGNPFFSGAGTPMRLAYYYLWHFSAAELSLLANVSGWEADAGLTWFTAFSSLAVMIGFATWLSGRAASALWVVALAATGSLRPLLYWVFGVENAEQVVGYRSGFGGWLFQTSWAPQHTASAMCAVLAVFLLVESIGRFGALRLLLFALIMTAGFGSSTWVGGITFPVAAISIALFLLVRAESHQRMRIVVHLAIAAILAIILISPLLYDQLRMTAMRGFSPIAIAPYEILGDNITDLIGDAANLPAYWLIFLVVEFPAFYLTGLAALFYLLKDRALTKERKSIAAVFAVLLAASLGVAWLLASTLSENNDLGWRAALPGVMLLIVFAAVGLSRLQSRSVSVSFASAIVLIVLGIPDGAGIIYGNIVVAPSASAKAFADAPQLWQAVRRYSAADERIADNPLLMADVTPWGANISWALLSNRRSCYAGDAFTGPFTALPQERRDQIDAQFVRVFAGHAAPGDVGELATRYDCDVAVIAPGDGAWSQDPFASSSSYRLVEGNRNWRIYKRVEPQR